MTHLASHGIRCPQPVKTRLGETLGVLAGRPATIIVLRPAKSAGILDVLVVGIKCSASVADVIFQITIPG